MTLIIEIALGIVLGQIVWTLGRFLVRNWPGWLNLPTPGMVYFWSRHPVLKAVAYLLLCATLIATFGGIGLALIILINRTPILRKTMDWFLLLIVGGYAVLIIFGLLNRAWTSLTNKYRLNAKTKQ